LRNQRLIIDIDDPDILRGNKKKTSSNRSCPMFSGGEKTIAFIISAIGLPNMKKITVRRHLFLRPVHSSGSIKNVQNTDLVLYYRTFKPNGNRIITKNEKFYNPLSQKNLRLNSQGFGITGNSQSSVKRCPSKIVTTLISTTYGDICFAAHPGKKDRTAGYWRKNPISGPPGLGFA
jgi:hypothetical protein